MAGKNTVEIILSAKDQASKAVSAAMGTVQGSLQTVRNAASVAVAATTAAIGTLSVAIGKTGIDYNAMAEQSQIAWKTLLGTQEQAKAMMKDIASFAKATPFETEQVDQMAKYMHNAGLAGKDLFNELMKISDVASAFSVPADSAKEMARQMAQVRNAGVAYTEDLNILEDRGVPIMKTIAKNLGITTAEAKKMAGEGKITSDIYLSAFNNISKAVEGASKDQSETYLGMMSTLRDNIKSISGQLTKDVFENLRSGLAGVMPVIEKFSATLQEKGLRQALSELLPPDVAKTANDIVKTVKAIYNAFMSVWYDTGEVPDVLAKIGIGPEQAAIIEGVFQGIIDGAKMFKDGIATYLGFVKDYWVGAFETMKRMFQGEGNLGESLVRIFNTIKEIALPIFQDAVSFIKSTLIELQAFWKENGDTIIAAVKNFWSIIAAIFKAIAPVLLFIINMIWTNIKGVISGALDIIMGLIKVFAGLFTGDFSKMWEGIKQLFFGAIEFVWNLVNLLMIGRILGGIKAFVTNGVSAFSGFWTKTVEIFKNLDTHVWNIITSFVSKIVGKLKGFYDEGARIFGTLRAFGANTFQSLWSAISTVTSNIASGVVGYFKNMFTGAKFHFEGLLNSAKSIFTNIGHAISSPIDSAKTMIGKAIEGIKSFFKNFPKVKFGLQTATKTILGKEISYPTGFDVDWYDKGGIFYGPQIIGVGEKRPEIVGALDDFRKIVREESGAGKGGNTYHITVNKEDTAQQMVRILQREEWLHA